MAVSVTVNTHFVRSRKEWNLSEYVATLASPGAPPRSSLSLAVSESEQDECLARLGGEGRGWGGRSVRFSLIVSKQDTRKGEQPHRMAPTHPHHF